MSSSYLPQNKKPVIVLLSVVTISIGAVWYSHFQQVNDRTKMKAGIEHDKERLRLKKLQLLQQSQQSQQS